MSVAAVGCLAGVWLMLKTQNEKAEQQEAELAGGETILEVNAEEITGLSFETSAGTSSFVLQDDMWKKTDDETFPVDEDALLSPLSQMEELKSVRTLTEAESVDEFGFEEPQNVIRITGADGEETILTIGATNESTGNDYLMMNEDTSVIYTIDSAVCSAFSDDLYEYAVSEELPAVLAADISGVEIQMDGGGYHLFLEDSLWKAEDYSAKTAADETAENVMEADADTVNTALSSLSNLAYTDYLDHNCADLSVYGLENPAAMLTISWMEEVEVETEEASEEVSEETEAESEEISKETEAESEEISEKTEAGSEEVSEEAETESETEEPVVMVEHQITFAVGNTDASGNYYVQMDGSAEVHTLGSDVLQSFLTAAAADWAVK